MRRHIHDRGAAAVEFAILLPVLVALTFGIFAFGHAFHVQTTLDNAARDAVRVATLTSGSTTTADANARQAAITSARATITLRNDQITIDRSACASNPTAGLVKVTVRVTNFQLLGGIGQLTLAGSGSMRCSG